MRNVTERPEAIEAGTARLVGCGERIGTESIRLLEDRAAYLRMSRAHNPFGDGRAADRIVQSLLNFGHCSRRSGLRAE
jgi:UDP-N-acetylglucosamine 2-epimerase (non-hydrolysing)